LPKKLTPMYEAICTKKQNLLSSYIQHEHKINKKSVKGIKSKFYNICPKASNKNFRFKNK